LWGIEGKLELLESKKIKYQQKYLLRELKKTNLVVTNSQDRRIRTKHKRKLFDYSLLAAILIGIGGIIFNIIENYSPLIYFLSVIFFLVGVLSLFLGYFKNKNNFFSFDPVSSSITYSNSIQAKSKLIDVNKDTLVWSEIQKLGIGGRHKFYSVYFYAKNMSNGDKKTMFFTYDNRFKSNCLIVGKAINRYFEEMSVLKDIILIEN
jgi:hypothetical protein